MGLPAWGAVCVAGTEASYEALGAGGCTVGPLQFSNVLINASAFPPTLAIIGPIAVDPVQFFYAPGNSFEYGLQFSYIASAFGLPISSTDVAVSYDVSGIGVNITDAYMDLTGSASAPPSFVHLDETLSNGVVLKLTAAGTAYVTFAPVASLHATKDQNDTALAGGTTSSSIFTNAFSVTAVPGPLAGAGIPGLLAACFTMVGLARRRRKAVGLA